MRGVRKGKQKRTKKQKTTDTQNGESYSRYKSLPWQLLRDERRERSAPSPGQWAFCWGLKWIVKGWAAREGRIHTALGREPLIRGETQIDRYCKSIFTQREAEGRTEPDCGYTICTLRANQILSAPKSSVSKEGPEPISHPGYLCLSP